MKQFIRQSVYNKYGGRCAYCGKEITYKEMQVDHLFPKCLAHLYTSSWSILTDNLIGESVEDFSNLMPSCRRCNHYKRAYRLEEFRDMMVTIHKRIAENYICKVGLDYGIIIIKPFSGKFYFETLEVTG